MAEEATFTAGTGAFGVTPEMLEAFATSGYILVRGLLSPAEVAHVKGAVENKDGVMSHSYGVDSGQEHQAKLCMWRHPGHDITGVLTSINKIAGTMQQLMGNDEIYHYHTKLMMKEANTGGAFVWHQDYGYWYNNGCLLPEMGSVFMPVDDCTRENGCLQVLTGSHKLGRIHHVTIGKQLSADPERLAMIRERYPLHHVEMSAGDVLFFGSLLLHCSAENSSPDRRYALIASYNKRLNNPMTPHHHPQYTPLELLDDSCLLACSASADLSGKEFNQPESDVSYRGHVNNTKS